MDLGLSGRTALVTGSYRGTGSAIATVLAQEGAHVLVHGFEAGQPDAVVDQLVAGGHSAAAVIGDIATDEGADALVAQAGSIDVLVNNYGAPGGSNWQSMDTWVDEWNINVLTGVRMVQRCSPSMREQGWGRIIFLGTVGIHQPSNRNAGYYAAKTALPTLIRSLAMELRGTGVTSNLVSPGMIATTEVQQMIMRRAARHDRGDTWEDAQRWALDESMPNLTERIPAPEDIARVVAFIASEAAWHVNGSDIPVDGGRP